MTCLNCFFLSYDVLNYFKYDEQERVATRIRYGPKATEIKEEEDFWVPAIIKAKKKDFYTTPE